MTIGIYLLSFQDTDKVYVGQSSRSIENRFKDHVRHLKNQTHSDKMNKAFLTHGTPELEILEECVVPQLDERELYHINLWNAVTDGFNSSKDVRGGVLLGDKHPASKYSNDQVEEVFMLLADGVLTHQEIADRVKVSKNSVNYIAAGGHTWLRDIHTEAYDKYYKDKIPYGTSIERGKVYPTIKSPEGIEYSSISNVRAFAREFNIPYSSLNSLLNFRTNATKGWARV